MYKIVYSREAVANTRVARIAIGNTKSSTCSRNSVYQKRRANIRMVRAIRAFLRRQVVRGGSLNFTAAASSKNAESVIVLNDPTVAQRYGQEWERMWAKSEPLTPRY
jgi:hypothetical protein